MKIDVTLKVTMGKLEYTAERGFVFDKKKGPGSLRSALELYAESLAPTAPQERAKALAERLIDVIPDAIAEHMQMFSRAVRMVDRRLKEI